ncbi:hypothetical protein Ancab_010379 [Ancistrocladus abbreviatus]
MEKKVERGAHVLFVPYPAQGHINPMLQFGKRLAIKGVQSTLAATIFMSKSIHLGSGLVQIDTISDGYDECGFAGAESVAAYVTSFRAIGSRTLSELISRHSASKQPISCVVYDPLISWVLDVAKEHDLAGAAYFTMPCAVNTIVYYVSRGLLSLPISSPLVSIPGLPFLKVEDLHGFLGNPEQYPDYLQGTLDQYSNMEKADYVLINTVYEWENKVVDSISSQLPFLTVGPTVPSIYIDNRVEDDKFYGFNLFNPDNETAINWLKDKPPSSVVYASFGTIANLCEEQIKELAQGLKASDAYFLLVIRGLEQAKLPEYILGDKGMLVHWTHQLEVLANEAIGCFFNTLWVEFDT